VAQPNLEFAQRKDAAPDSWDRDFLFRFSVHGFLPILALLGAQFPSAFQRFLPWIGRAFGGWH